MGTSPTTYQLIHSRIVARRSSLGQVEKTKDGQFWTASATAIVRVSLQSGCGHEDVGNAHFKDRDKGEVLHKAKKVCTAVRLQALFFLMPSFLWLLLLLLLLLVVPMLRSWVCREQCRRVLVLLFNRPVQQP